MQSEPERRSGQYRRTDRPAFSTAKSAGSLQRNWQSEAGPRLYASSVWTLFHSCGEACGSRSKSLQIGHFFKTEDHAKGPL